MKKRKERKEKKNAPRRASKNGAEEKCKAAAETLIADGRLDEYMSDPVLDAVGIDCVLHKYVCLAGEGSHKYRISLHLQIKQTEEAADEHCEKYPAIPVLVVQAERIDIQSIATEIWMLFCEYFQNGIYGKYLE